ncbi:hypothetical protein D6C90_07439 [Aureobasidium pullulans]|uniref:XPG-I domain-containing protein n=1 Tax=Aureobasidium pullulans TaxID=5580 RepID=A0A4S9UCF2_AURPU|nr:hypothetical protein D6C90_07439 [Aureobasidium pullulans]
MGIPGLWDILGEGEVKSLAQLSTEHYKKHNRPLRVAVDEAGWRFHNLNDAQVAAIRQKVPEANPIEKAILWRVLKLMRMNIQPIFIFDGPSRPWKRGGVAGRIDWKKIDLLRKTLDHLKIPHHRAPAEAEAECARLNELGIVDAVWTDDGDALMFGTKVLIKEHREGKTAKKSDNLVRIYRADVIEQKHRINRQGLILFALLSGGDYDTKGPSGCGPMAALEAAQFDNGRLGKILCESPLRQLHCFTESLRTYFQMPGSRNVYVPPGYPRDLHVKNYREPKVSTVEQASNLNGLNKGWNVPVDEKKLRVFLLERFNFTTRDKNLVFEIELVHKRGRNHDEQCLERQVTFNPKRCTEENCWTQPPNEDWEALATKTGGAFDPALHVEVEFLEYVLAGALGETEMRRLKEAASQLKSRKRKTQDSQVEDGSQTTAESADTTSQSTAKKQKKAAISTRDVASSSTQEVATSQTTVKPPTKRKPSKRHGKDIPPTVPVGPEVPESTPPPVKKGFQLPRALVRNPSMLSEMASQSSQTHLSRSASYHSVESTPMLSREPSGLTASTSFSNGLSHSVQDVDFEDVLDLSAAPSRAARPMSFARNGPPSSQYHPEAGSWTAQSITPPDGLVWSPSPEPTRLPAVQPCLQKPVQMKSQQRPVAPPLPNRQEPVVVDLLDDDEDTPRLQVPPAPKPHVQSAIPALQSNIPAQPPKSAVRPEPLDPRQQIAAARLKHFEQMARQAPIESEVLPAGPKKVHETIDLTLED